MKFARIMLNEMSRASDRSLGKESMENLFHILSDHAKNTPNPTYNKLREWIEKYGLDWDKAAKMLGISPTLGTARSKVDLLKLVTKAAENQGIDLDAVAEQVELDKDDIDEMIDIFWEYYEAKQANDAAAAAEIASMNKFKELVNWVRDNRAKAEEAFGRYAKELRYLTPFIMGDKFKGSIEEALEEFWNWHRAKKLGDEYRISRDILERLATMLESDKDKAMEITGDYYYYMIKEVGKMLGRKLGDEPPLTKELKRIMAALDNPAYIDQIEAEEKARARAIGAGADSGFGDDTGDSIGFDILPAAALRRIVDIAAQEGAVDKAKVGKVDKQQVRQCYTYCMNQLNRKFHVGEKGAFDGTLQEFYDKFKIVFNRGYTIGTLKKIFDEVTTFLVDQLDKSTAAYWQNKEEINADDDDDFNEAYRFLRANGYRVIKESASRRPTRSMIRECDDCGCKPLYYYESDEQRDICQKLYNLFDFECERAEGIEKAYSKAVKEFKNLYPDVKASLIPANAKEYAKKFGRSISL